MKKFIVCAVLLTAAVLLAGGALYAQDVNTSIEFLRTDVKAKKQEIVAKAMRLSEKEAVFWPLYRAYTADLAKVVDERLAVIKDYANSYESITDAKATELMNRMFSLERKMLDLKQKYFKEMSTALSPRVAGRFTQVENYLNNLINLSIGGEVPLMPKPEDIKPEAPAQGGAAK